MCQEAGYTYLLPAFLLSLGALLMQEGNYERGAALNEEAEALFREHGYKGRLQFALNNLGWVVLLQGNHERDRRYYGESLVVCKELGDKMIASDSLRGWCVYPGPKEEPSGQRRYSGWPRRCAKR